MSSVHSRSLIKPSYYPVFLCIAQKPCVVVGGGKVAERKVKMLLKFQASVILISPEVTPRLLRYAEENRIKLIRRPYKKGDLKNALLVFAATNDGTINQKVKEDAQKVRIPVNVADNPDLCDFIVPSIIKKGPIVIAISTSATLPLLSKKLRKEISGIISDKHITYVKNMGRFRKMVMKSIKDEAKRKQIMRRIERMHVHDVLSQNMKELNNLFFSRKK